MSQGPLRYARALHQLAIATKEASRVTSEVKAFSDLLTENQPLNDFFARPRQSRTAKVAALRLISDQVAWHHLTFRFLAVVATNGRLAWLSDIVKSLLSLEKQAQGACGVKIVSAQPLSAAKLTPVVKVLRSHLDSEVDVSHSCNPDLIGGYTIRIGSLLIDNSVRTQLAQLKKVIEGTA